MGKMEYVRTDRNGTEIYYDYTCTHCGGQGGCDAWIYTGWTCYKCGGTGKQDKPQIYKKYTPEYRAILDARNAARQKKLMEKAQAEKETRQAEWLSKKGFVDGKIHVVDLSDTFQMKDKIKEAGGRFDSRIGWYFSTPSESFPTVELTKEECFTSEDGWGMLQWNPDLQDVIKSKSNQHQSEWIGSVGDKVNMEVTYVKCITYNTHFTYYGETHFIHQFKDQDGNILIWNTSKDLEKLIDNQYVRTEIGSKVQIKGSIKEHSEYEGTKQTVLTRCRIA